MQGGYRFSGRVGSSPTELGLQVEVVHCDSELTALQCSCVMEREAPSTLSFQFSTPLVPGGIFNRIQPPSSFSAHVHRYALPCDKNDKKRQSVRQSYITLMKRAHPGDYDAVIVATTTDSQLKEDK